ncbi:MAG: alpha/beta fold hydrolase [Gammaproteobacteria bacterium]|nr:alpha/beta fold hydrolase [Gammaproteobacteria bacterium]
MAYPIIAWRLSSGLVVLFLLLLWGNAEVWSTEQGSSPQPPETKSAEESVKVSVWFATNRKREASQEPAEVFSGDRGTPQVGRCEVEFEPIPYLKQLAREVNFYLPGETSNIRVVDQTHGDLFWKGLADAVERTESKSLVVFLHGYNYGFERTCKMSAALQRALGGKATLLMFSWPSNGRPTDYVRDQADVEWSVPYLASLLGQLGERLGRSNVQVLAHSLGSRGIFFALQRMGREQQVGPAIGALTLLAPDFDSQTFVDILPELRPLTGGITLYASDNDAPLKVSRRLSGYPRLGEAGEFLTVAAGMETIDVTPAGRYQFLGHEYFFFHPRVTADLVELLGAGKRAAQRTGLRERVRDGVPYWEITEGGKP